MLDFRYQIFEKAKNGALLLELKQIKKIILNSYSRSNKVSCSGDYEEIREHEIKGK